MSIRSQRKDDHVALALSQSAGDDVFSNFRFVHNSLPNIDYDAVSLESHYFGASFPYPVYINAMTGGSEKTQELNRKLALIAAEFGLAMAVGSQHVALDEKAYRASFETVRFHHPNGFLIANVGAGASVAQAQAAIAMIDANALGIHINVAQELTMDEGDRSFASWLDNIEAIVRAVSVPVIVKEVGFGMSAKTVNQLIQRGVQYVDVSGRGGTNFVAIENARSRAKRYDYLNDWGLSAIESLLMTKALHNKVEVVASGGVSNPLDVLKLIRLGARAVGISGMFLRLAQLEDAEMLVQAHAFFEDLRRLMTLLGAETMADLASVEYQLKETWGDIV